MQCPICNGPTGTPEWGTPRISIVRCLDCGFRSADLETWVSPYTDRDYHVEHGSTETQPTAPLHRHRVSGIQRFAHGGLAVDLGCGLGETAVALANAGFATTGVDDSQLSIARLQQEYPQVNWICADIETFLALENQFDLITLYHVLEHIPQPRSLVKAIERALKPTGLLVIEVPNTAGLHAKLRGYRWQYWLDHHVNYFDDHSLRQLMEPAGLRQISSETKYHFNWPQGKPLRDGWHDLLRRFGFGDVLTTFWKKAQNG